ncbi:MAG: ABC transporter ATP-binding protein [Anaerolineales bacterium]|nr:ABC transporter ATP-binding protein [Anaerolineales bacterium]MCB8950648.1 ABC transporter ATP-binding protein [Ardenticatenales bacterium]
MPDTLGDNLKDAIALLNQPEKLPPLKKSELKWVWAYIKPHWKQALWAIFLMTVVALLFAPIPYMTMVIMDSVLPQKDSNLLVRIVIVLVILQLIRPIISFIANYNFTILGQSIQISLREDIFRHLLRLPLTFFERNQSGYLVARISEVSSLSIFFSNAMLVPLLGLFEFCIGLVMMLMIDWRLTIVVIAVLPALLGAAKYQGRGIQSATKSLLEQNAVVSQHIQESLSGVKTIKEFATEERESQKIVVNLQRLFRSSILRSLASAIADESLTTIIELMGLVILGLSGFAILNSTFTVGEYIAFSAYMLKFFGPTKMLATLGLSVRPAMAGMRRVNELLAEVIEEADPRRTIRISALAGAIELRKVSFSYGEDDVLQEVTLAIKPGECTALVGPSGGGKTTLIRLLLGLYPVKSGQILIDGQDLSQIILSGLRDRIGIVSQNVFLFNSSLRDNILYGLPDASEVDLLAAAKAADAHDFIMAMPQGYDTVVGEQGVRLSGGQKQRISIARTLLKNPDVVIFDEATSQLDGESESRIWRAAEKLFANKTRIIISHRIASVTSADQIALLENGRIVAAGKHNALLLSCDRYRELLTVNATVQSSAGNGQEARFGNAGIPATLMSSDVFNRAYAQACKMLGIDAESHPPGEKKDLYHEAFK